MHATQSKVQLESYQEDGVRFLAARTTALLADEMGLGKSAQLIRAADEIGAKRAVVVCPAIARVNWGREIQKFAARRGAAVIIESKKDIAPACKGSFRWYILSYDLVGKFVEYLTSKAGWKKFFDVLIGDEIHLVKNRKTKRAKSLLGEAGLVRLCLRFWPASGTPMPNNPSELWLLLKVMGVTRLNYAQFTKRYCNCFGGWDERFKQYTPLVITGAKKETAPELKHMLSQVMLRRKARGYLKQDYALQTFYLPKPATVPLSVAQHFTNEELETIEHEEQQAVNISDLNSLMLQADSISTLRRFNGLLKVAPVLSLVSQELEADAYQKIVIFAHHKQVIHHIWSGLRFYHSQIITGEGSAAKKQTAIDLFQNNPAARVVVASILAAGTAINLTAASHVLIVEPDYVPANNQQAICRVLRRGNDQKVFVRLACLAHSVDERITEIIKDKLDDINIIIGS